MRTTSIIGFGVLALASSSVMAASLQNSANRQTFKGQIFPQVTGVALSGPEATAMYDVTGIDSIGELEDPANFSVNWDIAAALGAPSGTPVTVHGVGYDVTITAFDPSWLSEIAFYFGNGITDPDGLLLGISSEEDPGGPTNYTSPNIDITDAGFNDIVLPNGVLYLEFFEGFDDSSVNPDGLWNSGMLAFNATASNIPEPTTLGLVGLVSLISLRRARRA